MTPDPITLSAGLNQNATLFRGEDHVITVDMTGYDLATATVLNWWLATSPYSINFLINKSLGSGITVNGNSLDIQIDSEDTIAIKPQIYYQEMRITLADGSVKVTLAGNIVIRMSLNPEELP